jgi:hypothetical protein
MKAVTRNKGKKKREPGGRAYNSTTSPMLQLHYIAHQEQTGQPE